MGQTTESASTRGEEDSTGDAPSDPALSVLSDLLVYDTMEKAWSSHIPVVQQGIEQPAARYAHLSAITNGCLVIVVGGHACDAERTARLTTGIMVLGRSRHTQPLH